MSVPKICLLTGEKGSGKTTFLLELHRILKSKAIRVGGILAMGAWKNNQRHSFTLHNLSGNGSMLFCTRDEEPGWIRKRHFYINPMALEFGRNALNPINLEGCQVAFIDEIGPFELSGEGWAESFSRLIGNRKHHLVVSVRSSMVEDVMHHWGLNNCCRFDVREKSPEQLSDLLLAAG